MFTSTDQLGNTLKFTSVPKRIVSLVPSQSEFLWDIGLREELVGITKFCIHPTEMFQLKERVGGTKKLSLEKIRRLKPDLIIGNKEENERSQIEELQKEFPVWMSDIFDFKDAIAMMNHLGTLLGKQKETQAITTQLNETLPTLKNSFPPKKVAYFIWNKPYMLAATNTYVDSLLTFLGFKNAAEGFQRYPEVNAEQLKNINPDVCFLSTEPFPFEEKHIKELKELLQSTKIVIVDGEMFSWYGSRLLRLGDYLHRLKRELEE